MRVGQVVKLVNDRKFGFIRAENFRNDVFFHYSTVVGSRADTWYVGQEVEFDLNEVRRLELGDLEASVVQIASRPLSHKLDETQLPGMSPIHHPKARRRRPGWRNKESGEAPPQPTDTATSEE